MKNLREELKKLDKEDLKVSPDFSKKVMQEVKKEQKNSRIITIVRSLSAACVVCVLGVVSVNFYNRASVSVSSSSYGLKSSNEPLSTNSVEPNINVGNIGISTNSEGYITSSSKVTNASDIADNYTDENYSKGVTFPDEVSSDSISISKSLEESNATLEVSGDLSNNDFENQTYSKQMKANDYLNEICELLKNNKYDAIVNSEEHKIEIKEGDVSQVSLLIENYIDAYISLESGDRISIILEK